MSVITNARSASRLALYGALASLVGVIASACGSTEEKLKAAKISEGCSLASECAGDLVCIFGRCHRECDADKDCEDGQRCVKGDEDTNVCQLEVETTCEHDKDCKGDQICAVDSECHDPCTSVDECIAKQVCVPTGACASSDPTRDELDATGNLVTKKVDGGTPGAGGAGGAGSGGSTSSGGKTTGPDASAGGDSSSGGESGAGGEEGSGGEQGSGGAGTGGQSADSGITCSGSGLERFRPSNLPQGYTVPSAAPAYTHTNSNCIFDTDDIAGPPLQGPHFTCAAAANVTSPTVVTLSDGREAAVLPLASLTIPTGVTLKIAGQRPVIIAVNGDVAIHGTIIGATGAVTKWVAGGATWRTSPYLSGLCPIETVAGGGGGARSNDESGGAGGGFCGKGGNSTPANAPIVLGGVTYGTESLVPLVGGSSGGMGSVATTSGPAGGGAVQIVSGSSILLGDTAVINMGGWASIEASKSRGGGGGSGGAILLEAPNITVRGVVAANGAAGSSGYLSHPLSGLALNEAATDTNGNGANGAAGDTAAGSDGPAGGGGGAGRIRINTGCGGTITILPTAIISPSETSGCYTRGALQ